MKKIFKLIDENKLEVSILKKTNPSPVVKIPFVALLKNKAGLKILPFWLLQKRPTKRSLKICAENYNVITLDRFPEETLLKMCINPRHLYWIGSFTLQNKALLLKFWGIEDISKIEPKIQMSCNSKSYYPEYIPLGEYYIKIENGICSMTALKLNRMVEILSNGKMTYLEVILHDNNVNGAF